MAAEQWRRIPQIPTYQVSDRGRIKHKGKILSKVVCKHTGHLTVSQNSVNENGKRVTRMVGRLVLEAFVGPAPPKMYATFRDGDKTNVVLDNLYWSHRTHPNKYARVSESDIARAAELFNSGMSRKEIAEEMCITYLAACHRLRRAGLCP